jgi:type II restriction enzyme
MDSSCAAGYTSGSQIARRVTEEWGASNLYCASCESDSLSRAPCNTKAVDFVCPNCSASYQLKARRRWNPHRVADAAYSSMLDVVMSDRVPNLLVMQYSHAYSVQNLMLVPSFFFAPTAVEKRRPLAATARRAGWVGCNILLDAIATQGKVRLVVEGSSECPAEIRRKYAALRPLAALDVRVRGWTLDVLRIVQNMPNDQFTLADAYKQESRLAALHPSNRNIRAKIRQQLQILRDLGFLAFEGHGNYKRMLR